MFEHAMGRRQADLMPDAGTRRAFAAYLERVFGAYGEGGGVDVEILEGQLALTAETRAYLYEGDFTPRELPYVPGSRPLLEQTVAEVVTPGLSARETALALLRRCRDNRDRGLRGGTWYGGSEEELLKRGAIMCNEISRVFVCLCQVAGLRARVMCAHLSGHVMAEVEVSDAGPEADGEWWWMDPMQGCCCLRDDGRCASTWDLWQDPGLFLRQPPERLADLRPTGPFHEGEAPEIREANVTWWLAAYAGAFFHPKEAIALGNYFAWEQDRYTYPWFQRPADPVRLLRARRQEARLRRDLGWPEAFVNPYLLGTDEDSGRTV